MSPEPGPERRAAAPAPLMVGPGTGPMDRRNEALLWGAGTLCLGLAIAFLLAQGEIRTIVLLLLAVLGLLCLSPRRGVFVLLLFLPFMYYIRRQVLYFNEFSKTDPILLFPPLVTVAMFLGSVVFHNQRFYGYLRASTLLKLIVALLVIFAVQMFNPMQGSVLVGIAAAIYFIIPMLWVFTGLLLDEKDIQRVFFLVIVIGTTTATYGLYQHYFGLSDVERYELEAKQFVKALGTKTRIMSTFASLGDFSLYLSTAGFLAFAFFWRNKARLGYLLCLGVMSTALLWIAVRTSFFALIFSIITFLIVNVARPRQVLLRGSVALLIVASLYGYLYQYSAEDLWVAHGSNNPFIVHTVAGMAHPTRESSFWARMGTWGMILRVALTQNPVGRGLGSTTVAAVKFSGEGKLEADSYFFELIYGSGILAGLLFAAIVYCLARDALALAVRTGRGFAHRVVVGLLASFLLGSLFGMDLRDSISGPLGWLLIGWMVRESVDRSEASPGTEAPVGVEIRGEADARGR